MAVDKATVARIAALARIKVTEGEQELLAGELSKLLDWIEQLAEVNTDGVEPMTSVVHVKPPMRPDVVNDGEIRDQLLANAPQDARGFFVVPKVVE